MIKKIAIIFPVLIVITLLFAVYPRISFDQDLKELEVDHALTFEVRSPHIKWAQPYAQGKIRVLFFVDGRGTHPRECVELMQRFDIEADAAFYARIPDSNEYNWHSGKEGIKRMEALLERDWDVFVFFGIDPAKMPEHLRRRIVQRVRAGAGVLLSGVDDHELLPAADEKKATVSFLAGLDDVRTFYLGKGRGIQLTEKPVIEYAEGWQNAFESRQEGLGRAIVWAAGREPQGVLSFMLSKDTYMINEQVNLGIKWSGPIIGEKPALQLWVRKPVGWSAPWPDREIKPDEIIDVILPRLPAGRYHLDGRVASSAGVESWATIPFEVMSPRKVTNIVLDSEWGEIGGKISGRATLSGPAGSGEKVRIDVLDKDRRVLMRHDFTGGSDRVDFAFDIFPWLPMLLTVEATVMDRDELVTSTSKYFNVTQRNRDQFNFLIWDAPRGTLAPYAEEVLARTGVTLQLVEGEANPYLYAAAHNIAWVPYTIHIRANPDEKGIMKPFCWNNAASVERSAQMIADKHLNARRHGIFAYSLGDEIATQGACLAETCLHAYRNYLKEVYGTLDALNLSWGTIFSAWEDVVLASAGDNEEASALAQKNYPRWFDRQAFKSYNFVRYALQYARAFSGIDPQAKTGFEGAGYLSGGDDIDLIVRSMGFWSPYAGTADEVIRSIAPRDFIRSNWMGYTKDADSLLQKYWRMVTRGMDSVWWWRWECVGKFHGWLAPDFRPYPAVEEILRDTQIVRDGLGDLLLKSRMQDDGIAVLYSYPSTFAYMLHGGISAKRAYEKAHVGWHRAIRDLGLQFSYVTDRMLRLGEFDKKRFRVIVLSRTEMIGDKEAAVIKAFVKEGGLVIADMRPGIYNDHCKKREAGVLDELFGIEGSGRHTAKAVLPSEGRAAPMMAGVPSLILNKYGKGHALLLNGDVNMINALKPEILTGLLPKIKGQSSPAGTNDDALKTILQALAGINADIFLKKEDGTAMRNVEVIRWKNGQNDILALFRQGGRKETAVVALSKAGYVYDMRHRRSLGFVKEFKTEILPNRASFFAVTAKAVPPVHVQLPGKGQRGKVAKALLSIPGAQGSQAVLVTAKFPTASNATPPRAGDFFPRQGYPLAPGRQNDEKRDLLKRVVILGNKPVSIDFPIAFNDPSGNYEISVTELFSNKTVTKELTIQ